MRAEDPEALREHMLAVIAANAFALRDTIGKSAFDERVMTAIRKVPRHDFVPIELQPYAYANIPLPIGFEKSISQPFIVALMTDLLDIKADDSVLEIGTGLGYQTAILAQLARKVFSFEIIEELGQKAKQRLRRQGCSNVELKIANGYHGWSEHAQVVVPASFCAHSDLLAAGFGLARRLALRCILVARCGLQGFDCVAHRLR